MVSDFFKKIKLFLKIVVVVIVTEEAFRNFYLDTRNLTLDAEMLSRGSLTDPGKHFS